jgi:hypothetical protein
VTHSFDQNQHINFLTFQPGADRTSITTHPDRGSAGAPYVSLALPRFPAAACPQTTKAPFGVPQQVLEFLGRYTHREAISNRRRGGLLFVSRQAGRAAKPMKPLSVTRNHKIFLP